MILSYEEYMKALRVAESEIEAEVAKAKTDAQLVKAVNRGLLYYLLNQYNSQPTLYRSAHTSGPILMPIAPPVPKPESMIAEIVFSALFLLTFLSIGLVWLFSF